jgi:phage baseplate assembly protein W
MSQVKKVYNFKSVGELDTSYQERQEDTRKSLPIGILTPISFGTSAGSLFSMSHDIATQISDNLKNLISTNEGERLTLADFGANLRPLALEMTAENIDAEAVRRISRSVSKYMPFVELETFEPRVEKSSSGNVVRSIVKITYAVPTLGISNQAVEAIILVAG